MEKFKGFRSKALEYAYIGGALIVTSSVPGVLNPPSIFALGILFLLVAAAFYLNTKVEWQEFSNFLEYIETIPVGPLGLFLTSYGVSIWLIQEHHVIAGIFAATITYCVLFDAVAKLLKNSVLRPVFNRLNVFQPSAEIPKEFKNHGWGL